MKDELIQEAIIYVEELFSGNSDGHDAKHTMRVYHNAMKIAENERCDLKIVALAALLHDVDDPKLFHTTNNANARAFLSRQEMDGDTAEKTIAAINLVSFSKNKDKKPDFIEAQVVQDADRLDAIGAVGVARTFAFGGRHERDLEDSITHFHEKLLLLKDMMNTDTAKEMAKERHQFMISFLTEWEKETGEYV